MSELEEFIKKNREAFDTSDPESGHMERFGLKLDRHSTQVQKPRELFWRIAAAAIVLAVVGLSVWMPRAEVSGDVQYGSLSLSEVSEEFAQVEAYYTSKIETKTERIELIANEDAEAASYLEELERLKLDYKQLEKELYDSGAHEKVITAMIENFRLRLTLIEKLEAKRDSTQIQEIP